MTQKEIKLNKKYKPLWTADYDIAIVLGGRGSSKSYTVNTFLLDLTRRDDHGILFTRYTTEAAEKSIIPEFKEKLDLHCLNDDYSVTQKDIISKRNDSFIMFRGIKASSGNQTAKLKSIPGLSTFVVDEAEEFTSEDDFDTIRFSIRQKGIKNRVIIVLNPSDKTHWIYKKFFEPHKVPNEFNGQIGRVLYIHTTYQDNIDNLAPEFLHEVEELKRTDPKKYRHKIRGHWAEESEHALWKKLTMIDPYRIYEAPPMKRIVVSCDPNVTDTARQKEGKHDEVGVIIAGLGYDDHGYLLKDSSGLYGPDKWKNVLVGEFTNFDADNIVAEVNNGGDLIKMAIRTVKKHVPIKDVRSTKGKLLRAEPVAQLAAEGMIHHVGKYPELEDEMTSFDGTGPSPNRLDAYVFAFVDLFKLTMKKAKDPLIW